MIIEKVIMVSIVLPAYQEEENLRILLPRISEQLSLINAFKEVLVIDTRVPLDDTQTVCEKFGARLVPRRHGDNYGDAVRTGIAESKGKYVIFMDADGSHSPEWINKLYIHREQNDVIIASRYVNQGYTENNMTLIVMSRILNLTYSIVLGIKCKDISNSYRLYNGNQLRLLNLKCNNFDIVEEILLKLYRNNKSLKILEVPFSFKKRLFGKSKRNLILFIITYLYTLFKLRITS